MTTSLLPTRKRPLRGPVPDGDNQPISQLSKRNKSRFIQGPIPRAWLAKAAPLPGKSLAVGMIIWFAHGMGLKSEWMKIPRKVLASFGIHPKAYERGLKQLEQAGLVEVQRQPGRCMHIRLIENHTDSNKSSSDYPPL